MSRAKRLPPAEPRPARSAGPARAAAGQGLVEYALILGLVSVIAVLAVTATGASVSAIWTKVSAAVTTAAAAVK